MEEVKKYFAFVRAIVQHDINMASDMRKPLYKRQEACSFLFEKDRLERIFHSYFADLIPVTVLNTIIYEIRIEALAKLQKNP